MVEPETKAFAPALSERPGAAGALVSTWTSWEPTLSELPTLSVEENSTVALLESVKGAA